MNQYSITFKLLHDWKTSSLSCQRITHTNVGEMQCVWEVNLHLPGRKAVSVWLQVLCSLSAKCVEVKWIENGQLSTVKFHRGVKKGMRGLRLACFLKGTSAQPCFNLTFKKKMTYRTHCCTEEKRWNKKRKRIKLHGIHHSKHCYQD